MAIVFFLWRHYTIQHERESDTVLEDRAKEIKDIKIKIKECRQSGGSSNDVYPLEMEMRELMG